MTSRKQQWWLTHRKAVDRYTREARALLAAQHPPDAAAALDLLDAALELSPRSEQALELRARALLFLRRFKDVADMLQDHIPSFRGAGEEDSGASTTSTSLSSTSSGSSQRDRARLLPNAGDGRSDDEEGLPWCLSVGDLKRRLLRGLSSGRAGEGQWRYLVLGQACSHLGMLEDATALLQTGRRLAAASCRRECLDLHDDSFSDTLSVDLDHASSTTTAALTPGPAELEAAAALLNHVKLLLRRRAAAHASLDAGLPADSVRHFSKILDNRRGVPHLFAAGCLLGRAAAYRALGRFAEAIADCNRALAIDPSSIPALRARAELLESVGSLHDALRDLDHLKLLYDAVLWDRKLPGPAWRPHNGVRYREIAGSLRALTARIQELRRKLQAGGPSVCAVDYHALFGLKRGCSRPELERAHLLLSLKHKPDKATLFVDRLEFADDNRDLEMVRDEARMSASILYRLLQKGYASILSGIFHATTTPPPPLTPPDEPRKPVGSGHARPQKVARSGSFRVGSPAASTIGSPFQGVFCRDLAVVSSLISKAGFSQTIPV